MTKVFKHTLAFLCVVISCYAFGNVNSDLQEAKEDEPPIQEHISISLIYPNPVQNTLFLDPAVLDRYSWLSIYTHTGRLVLEQDILESNSVNVNSLKPGIYIVLFEGSECILSLMMIKQ